jgi:hypothetical protein
MEKTLRDELAMSLEPSLIPTLENEATLKLVAEKIGLEYDLKRPILFDTYDEMKNHVKSIERDIIDNGFGLAKLP